MRNGTDMAERNGYGVKTRNGTERNGYGVKMRNGTDMGLKCGTERNGYGVKMRNGTRKAGIFKTRNGKSRKIRNITVINN
jgi:hypothetical protein